MRWTVPLLIVATVAGARADGGPPRTQQIQFDADDPHSIYVASNYGLLISHDDGCTFEWVCEPNVGYGNTYVPTIRVARGGAIFATTPSGLRVSRDGGCSFTTAIAQLTIAGLDIGPTGDVWAATAKSGATNDVLVSTDNGVTFASSGLASSTIYWGSVVVAPGDPARVYASGYEIGGALHLRRRDGNSWVVLPESALLVGTPARLVIATVDPLDPDVVYVVAEGALAFSGDRLYRSEDAGTTFAEVYSVDGLIRDVVARDDGTVIVTSLVRPPASLLYVGGPPVISTDGGRSFGPLANAPTLACLTVAPDGSLFGCGANWEPDFKAIARLDGDTWTKVWRFVELSGSLTCAAGTGGAETCDPGWPALDEIVKTTGPVCGDHIRVIEDVQPPIETCCGASHGPTAWLWSLVVAWRLRRRRSMRGAHLARW